MNGQCALPHVAASGDPQYAVVIDATLNGGERITETKIDAANVGGHTRRCLVGVNTGPVKTGIDHPLTPNIPIPVEQAGSLNR